MKLGLEVICRKRHMDIETLAERIGMPKTTLLHYTQQCKPDSISASIIAKVADYLDVTVDELIQLHPDDAIGLGDRELRNSHTEHPDNILAKYRHAKHITFDELAALIGVTSRQCPNQSCQKKTTRKEKEYVARLAAFENMSMSEFYQVYGSVEVYGNVCA